MPSARSNARTAGISLLLAATGDAGSPNRFPSRATAITSPCPTTPAANDAKYSPRRRSRSAASSLANRVRKVFSLGRLDPRPSSVRICSGAVRTQVAIPANERIPAAVARIATARSNHNGYRLPRRSRGSGTSRSVSSKPARERIVQHDDSLTRDLHDRRNRGYCNNGHGRHSENGTGVENLHRPRVARTRPTFQKWCRCGDFTHGVHTAHSPRRISRRNQSALFDILEHVPSHMRGTMIHGFYSGVCLAISESLPSGPSTTDRGVNGINRTKSPTRVSGGGACGCGGLSVRLPRWRGC